MFDVGDDAVSVYMRSLQISGEDCELLMHTRLQSFRASHLCTQASLPAFA
jgi:hypothetical protein